MVAAVGSGGGVHGHDGLREGEEVAS
jgi:hypothetical protein